MQLYKFLDDKKPIPMCFLGEDKKMLEMGSRNLGGGEI